MRGSGSRDMDDILEEDGEMEDYSAEERHQVKQ
jgi:hypothetical protein